jgi:hypothetical protein
MFRLFRAIFRLNLGGCVYIYIYSHLQAELRGMYVYMATKTLFASKLDLN